ncbi:MAG: hypothetical protein OH319_04855 [Candidatus Parvarchaeota archaeon]|nr:hypothetical protein [Candidatus Jingweiarchaeum tengchongense]MCW1297666.1 hypothetical protein [Candidatus Jingweiarchaeum tengchongense]MCW1299677.1 hypothetical protein [Candidatus Jingweiarchaeum tengchongense]MCW1304355.1 hypothetical protein [Candidatus Jingweiarchaeum tengchongense]MCW1305662.1 hypothetical protein [Candidatus Jingweiarchaeum tengchongense]
MVNPIKSDYIPLGEGKGITITLFPNYLVIERKEKKGNTWVVTEKVTLAQKILEYLFARIPGYIAVMDSENKGKR